MARIKANSGILGTLYTFRGPKSHRPVEIEVPHSYWMIEREAAALKLANSLFRNSPSFAGRIPARSSKPIGDKQHHTL